MLFYQYYAGANLTDRMKIFIKNMVTGRCRTIVKMELSNLGIEHNIPELGEIKLNTKLTMEMEKNLRTNLRKHGLEIVDDKKSILVEKIRNVIIELVHDLEERPITNYSVYISEKLNYDYTYLAKLFSDVRGVTIEQCIISHKIERVKELLVIHNLSLTQISKKLHYCSSSHLANQFKKVTGVTTSTFKRQKNKRISLEDVCS